MKGVGCRRQAWNRRVALPECRALLSYQIVGPVWCVGVVASVRGVAGVSIRVRVIAHSRCLPHRASPLPARVGAAIAIVAVDAVVAVAAASRAARAAAAVAAAVAAPAVLATAVDVARLGGGEEGRR